jgi:SAM-dependent methyltransferase
MNDSMGTRFAGPPPEWFPNPEAPSFGPFGVLGLEIGGGTHPRRLKFTQFDAIDWSSEIEAMPDGSRIRFDVGDARNLPYLDEYFGHVFSSNLLEHFSPDETTPLLTEWARVLKAGGYMELVVPDSMGILGEFFRGEANWPNTQERLLGSQSYEGNEHRNAFTISSFHEIFEPIEGLYFVWAVPCANGGGIHALAVKEE